MKWTVWIVGAVMAALWSGLCGIGWVSISWLGGLLGAGVDVDAVVRVAQMPLPAWVTLWLDPASLQWMRDGLAWLATRSADAGPWLAALIGAAGWLILPLWMLGLAVLLVLAGGAHWLVGRLRRANAAAPAWGR